MAYSTSSSEPETSTEADITTVITNTTKGSIGKRFLNILKEHLTKPEVYLPAGAIIFVIILVVCICTICRSRRRRHRKPPDSTGSTAVVYTKSKDEIESKPGSPGDGQISLNIGQTTADQSHSKESQAADKDDDYQKIESQFLNHNVGENGVVATTDESQSSATEKQTNDVPTLSDTCDYVEINVDGKEEGPVEKDIPTPLVENPYDIANFNGDEKPVGSPDHDYGHIRLKQEGDYDITERQGENRSQTRGIINSSPYDTIDIVNDVVDEETTVTTSIEIPSTTV